MGCHTAGVGGAGQYRLRWRRFSPTLTVCERTSIEPPSAQDLRPAANPAMFPGRAEEVLAGREPALPSRI